MDHGPERHRGEDGFRQGQDDLPQYEPVARPVDGRRLREALGQLLEVRPQDDDVPEPEGTGKRDGQYGVEHPEALDQEEVGDEPAAEEHRDREHDGEERLAAEPGSGQRVGAEHAEEQDHERADDRVVDGVEVRAAEGCAYDVAVRVELEPHGQEAHLAPGDGERVADREGETGCRADHGGRNRGRDGYESWNKSAKN